MCFSAFPCGSTALTADRCNQQKAVLEQQRLELEGMEAAAAAAAAEPEAAAGDGTAEEAAAAAESEAATGTTEGAAPGGGGGAAVSKPQPKASADAAGAASSTGGEVRKLALTHEPANSQMTDSGYLPYETPTPPSPAQGSPNSSPGASGGGLTTPTASAQRTGTGRARNRSAHTPVLRSFSAELGGDTRSIFDEPVELRHALFVRKMELCSLPYAFGAAEDPARREVRSRLLSDLKDYVMARKVRKACQSSQDFLESNLGRTL
eukprot:SAG22_NODE_77_length_22125_cov_46.140016_9_plen_264_part_00